MTKRNFVKQFLDFSCSNNHFYAQTKVNLDKFVQN